MERLLEARCLMSADRRRSSSELEHLQAPGQAVQFQEELALLEPEEVVLEALLHKVCNTPPSDAPFTLL
jgi:hypothetical protein